MKKGDPKQAYQYYFDELIISTLEQRLGIDPTRVMNGDEPTPKPQNGAGAKLRTGFASGHLLGGGQGLQGDEMVEVLRKIGMFKEKLFEMMMRAEQSGQVITKQQIDDFFADLKNCKQEK
mmetsp:Transcript_2700/g.4574  ORF Transcript_2700/g.4574 Transcript_2700/m.4574 type:complete len:120 (-) Transcript_2700:60-419(-)